MLTSRSGPKIEPLSGQTSLVNSNGNSMYSKQKWTRVSETTKKQILTAHHSYTCTELANKYNLALSTVWKIRKQKHNDGKHYVTN